MNIEFRSGFERDLSQTRDKKLAKIILDCIHLFEEANQLNDISNLKKMVGNPTAWRYRKGKYPRLFNSTKSVDNYTTCIGRGCFRTFRL